MTTITIINGPIGSGKTTVGKCLAQKLGGVFLDLDDIVLAHVHNWDKVTAKNEAAIWHAARQEAAAKMNQLQPVPKHIIIAGPFLRKEEVPELQSYLRFPCKLYFYSLHAASPIRYERTKRRENKEPSPVWYEELKRIEDGRQQPAGVVVVNETSVESAADTIVQAMAHDKGWISEQELPESIKTDEC